MMLEDGETLSVNDRRVREARRNVVGALMAIANCSTPIGRGRLGNSRGGATSVCV